MLTPRRVRGLPVFGFALGGLLAGHALSYSLSAPDPYHRDLLLQQTGHGYLPALAQIGVVLVLAATVALVARALAGRGSAHDATGHGGWAALAGRLALLQVGAFAAQEVLERVASGAPLGGLVSDRILATGVLAQVVVALAVAATIRWLARASARLAEALVVRPGAFLRPAVVAPVPETRDHARAILLSAARNVRGPPLA